MKSNPQAGRAGFPHPLSAAASPRSALILAKPPPGPLNGLRLPAPPLSSCVMTKGLACGVPQLLRHGVLWGWGHLVPLSLTPFVGASPCRLRYEGRGRWPG